MFGFGKKKTRTTTTKKAKAAPSASRRGKSTARKPAAVRVGKTSARAAQRSKLPCVICYERFQTDPARQVCGRKRCAVERAKQLNAKNKPQRAATPAKTQRSTARKPTAKRTAPRAARPAAPVGIGAGSATSNPAIDQLMKEVGQARQRTYDTWMTRHPHLRDDVVTFATSLAASTVLEAADKTKVNTILREAKSFTDTVIRRNATEDLTARRDSRTATRLHELGQELHAVVAPYQRAGLIRLATPKS